MKPSISMLSILILLSCVCRIDGQITNGGFEEWEDIEEYTKPVGWQTGHGFANYRYDSLIRDTISVEGDFSLKIVSTQGLSSCETFFNHEGLIPTFEIGERVSVFMNYRSISSSLITPDITYFQIWGNVYKSDSIVGIYRWVDTIEHEVFTEIEIPIEFSNPDSISMIIVGGANPTPIATDGCFHYTQSWLDDINVAPSTPVVETEDFSVLNKHEVKVFPNPSDGYVVIEQEIKKYKGLEVYDLYGRLILDRELRFPLDKIEYLKKGVYLIKLIGVSTDNTAGRNKIENIIVN